MSTEPLWRGPAHAFRYDCPPGTEVEVWPAGNRTSPTREQIEALAERVHQTYLDTCERLGWPVKPENQVAYAELSEDSKELDRASVRAVLGAAFDFHATYDAVARVLYEVIPKDVRTGLLDEAAMKITRELLHGQGDETDA